MWKVVELDNDDIHVIPEYDLKEHILSTECWCKPQDDELTPNVKIHNALDKREIFGTEREKLN